MDLLPGNFLTTSSDTSYAGPGIYSGLLSYSSQEPGDGIIDSAQLVPYPSNVQAMRYNASPFAGPPPVQLDSGANDNPISMAMTEHHFVLLLSDRVKVIRMLDDRVVYEEALDIVREYPSFNVSHEQSV